MEMEIRCPLSHLENLKQTYLDSPLAHKQKLISSIFPEKIEFYGKNVKLLGSMIFYDISCR